MAIPGAYFLEFMNNYFELFLAMIVSQALLGVLVFWVDRCILNNKETI